MEFYSNAAQSKNVIDDRYLEAFRMAVLRGQVRFNGGALPVLNNELMNAFLSLKMPTSPEIAKENATVVLDLTHQILRSSVEIYIDKDFQHSQRYVRPTDHYETYDFVIDAKMLKTELERVANVTRHGHDAWVEIKPDVSKMTLREQVYYAQHRQTFSDALGGPFADTRSAADLMRAIAMSYAIERAKNPDRAPGIKEFMERTGTIPVVDDAFRQEYQTAEILMEIARNALRPPIRPDDQIGAMIGTLPAPPALSIDDLYQSAYGAIPGIVEKTPIMQSGGGLPDSYFVRPSTQKALEAEAAARSRAEKTCTEIEIGWLRGRYDTGRFDGGKFEADVASCVEDRMRKEGYTR